MLKIGIQGGKASFHDIATRRFFKDQEVAIYENDTFRKVCEQLQNDVTDFALIAIENSIAGTIIPNYTLIEEYNLSIVGEYKLRIKQNLMALPGQKVEDLKVVRSHYMALMQCEEYLDQFPNISVEEYHDTADSARDIKLNNLVGYGAIAGDLAAKEYGLEILAESIETMKLNYTRFFVLSKKNQKLYKREELNKATLSFTLPNKMGALAEALKIAVDNHLNLTKIMSIPIIGKPDEYIFYVDCMWDDYLNMLSCVKRLNDLVVGLNVLGEYKNFEIDYDNNISK